MREEAQARSAPEASSIRFSGLTAPDTALNSAFSGSSYPPLNYASAEVSTSAMASGLQGFVPSPSDSMLSGNSNNNLTSESPVDFTACDFGNSSAARVNPATNGFNSSSSTGGGSLAPSPDSSLGLDAAFLQILYPAWPSTLPSPSIVSHLVHIFFTRATIPAAMFNKPRFLASMDLPPTSANFPETALLHAMCGYAALLVSEDTLSQRDEFGRRYWEGEKNAREYHYVCARKDIDRGVLSKSKTFQVSFPEPPPSIQLFADFLSIHRSSKRPSSAATLPTKPPPSPSFGCSRARQLDSALPSASTTSLLTITATEFLEHPIPTGRIAFA